MMKTKKIFFDTEFTGLHQSTTLISIGLISDCGKTFYAELTDYDRSQVTDWIEKNVISSLILSDFNVDEHYEPYSENVLFKGVHAHVSQALLHWLHQFVADGETKIEMWSDCLAYDWVLFHKLFGSAFDMPSWIYYIPFDLCTSFKERGIDPDISREDFASTLIIGSAGIITMKHNALWDAKVIRYCWLKLNQNQIQPINCKS
jgi:hypothetical protein